MQDKFPYDEPDVNLDDPNTGNEQGTDNGKNQNDGEPVKLSKMKTCVIFVAFLVVVMIVIMTVRSLSVSREVNSSQNEQTVETQQNTSQNDITSTGESDNKNSEDLADSDESSTSSSASAEDTNLSENSSDSTVDSDNSSQQGTTETPIKEEPEATTTEPTDVTGNNTLQEVSEPQLSESIKVQAVVSSKSIYLTGNSYVYQVDFLVLTDDNGNYTTLPYYCPKTTYDALTKGDSVNVEYQVDSSGNVSVASVTR